jgi:hypothetical protein
MFNLKTEPMVKFNNQVHTTTDYSMFKNIAGNRTMNELHLRRLKSSIMNKYLFTVIIVNEDYQIIDGQHRFNVIRELNLPLNYIICVGYGLREVQILNANSKNWSADDFMEGYCNIGKKDYIMYRNFKQKYGLGHNECMAILSGVIGVGGQFTEDFHNGLFKITHYEDACRKAELLKMIEPYYSGYKRRGFVSAMLQLFKNTNFEFTEFLQKLRIQQTALVDCVNTNQYLTLIEEIYNYKRRVKVNLRY